MRTIYNRFERSDGMRGLVEGLTSFITYLASVGQAGQIQGCLDKGVIVIATVRTGTKPYRLRWLSAAPWQSVQRKNDITCDDVATELNMEELFFGFGCRG